MCLLSQQKHQKFFLVAHVQVEKSAVKVDIPTLEYIIPIGWRPAMMLRICWNF
jgi:hypothetical protein